MFLSIYEGHNGGEARFVSLRPEPLGLEGLLGGQEVTWPTICAPASLDDPWERQELAAATMAAAERLYRARWIGEEYWIPYP